jgi:hypothetical protein
MSGSPSVTVDPASAQVGSSLDDEAADRSIERGGLLHVHHVPGVGDDDAPCSRHLASDERSGIEKRRIIERSGDHQRRTANLRQALQQLIPYIVTGGAGMYLGLVAWRRRNDASVRSLLWLRIPGEAIRDVGWIWALALPIFLAGSLFEFLQ